MATEQRPGIHVRQAAPGDLETLMEFNAAMAWETEGKALDPARLRAGVAAGLEPDGRGFYLVAEVSGRVVGQLLVTTEWSDWRNGDFWWMQSVYVDPGHRRLGVYRTLHSHVQEEARRKDEVCGLRLYVDRDNHVARQVYASLGMHDSRYDMLEIDFVLEN
jgi:GNAT superfamily N-acetyltransferase